MQDNLEIYCTTLYLNLTMLCYTLKIVKREDLMLGILTTIKKKKLANIYGEHTRYPVPQFTNYVP